MYPWPPDSVILFGARAVLSMLGILLILLGTWFADRAWDEEGGQSKANESTKNYQGMEEGDGSSSEAKAAGTKEEYQNMDGILDSMDKVSKKTIKPPCGKKITENKADRPLMDDDDLIGSSGCDGPTDLDAGCVIPESSCVIPMPEPGCEDPASWEWPTGTVLQRTKSFAWLACVGWMLLAISYIFDRHEWFALDWYSSILIWPCVVLQLVLGFLQNFLFRRAIELGLVHHKRYLLAATLGVGLFANGVLTAFVDPEGPHCCAIFGAVCLITAPIVLYKSRKMGETWDREGRVNPTPVVFNFGGPLTMYGWFWFWVGLNLAHSAPDVLYLQFYLTSRTWLAFAGSTLVLVVTWMVFYAMDEFPDYDNIMVKDPDAIPGFGVAGKFFGQTSEVKIGLTVAWTIFAVAALLPFHFGLWSILLFLDVVALGVVLSIWHERGLRAADWAAFEQWGKVAGIVVVMMIFLLIVQGISTALMAALAVLVCMEGLYLINTDRKRGLIWMETEKVHPSPLVYSSGPLVFTLGMLLLGWSMSIP